MKTFLIRHKVWQLLARLILGGLFVYSGILKIRFPLDFADSIAAYQLLPASLINLLALALPFFEVICGLQVLIGYHARSGAIGISFLLLIFMGAIGLALKKGLDINCGCFGGHSWLESNLWVVLVRNGVLLLLAIFVYWNSARKEALFHAAVA